MDSINLKEWEKKHHAFKISERVFYNCMATYKKENSEDFVTQFGENGIDNVVFDFKEISFNIRYINNTVNEFIWTKIYLLYENNIIGYCGTEFSLDGEVTDDSLVLY
jgi:hypothetical protein